MHLQVVCGNLEEETDNPKIALLDGSVPDICSLFASPHSGISFPMCLGLIPPEL